MTLAAGHVLVASRSLMIGFRGVRVIAVSMREIRGLVALVARLLFLQSNSEPVRIVARALQWGIRRDWRSLMIERTSERRTVRKGM